MINDVEKRRYVEKMYSGPSWKKRVFKMPDDQIFAIYMREQEKKVAAPKEAKPALPINNTLF